MGQPQLSKQDYKILELAKSVLEHEEGEQSETKTTGQSTEVIRTSEEADTTELTEYEQFEQAYMDTAISGGEVLPLIRFLQRKGASILVREDYVGDVADFEEPDWIVDGILVRNGLTLIYGESGVGKTTFLLNMANSIQNGIDFFGRHCERGNIIRYNHLPVNIQKGGIISELYSTHEN
ncbi:hypothetical protein ES708_21624 [subsurface metagenome]